MAEVGIAMLIQAVGVLVKAAQVLSSAPGTTKQATITTDTSAIEVHMRHVTAWSSTLSVGFGVKQHSLSDAYVRLRLQKNQATASRHATDGPAMGPEHLLATGSSALVLGEPGAGKTSLLKYLCQYVLTNPSANAQDALNFPLLVVLRQLPFGTSLWEAVLGSIGVRVIPYEDGNASANQQADDLRARLVHELLNAQRILLVLDGLDEVGPEHRRKITNQISDLSAHLTDSMVITTCRFGAMVGSIDHATVYAIEPLSIEDRKVFVDKWFDDPHRSAAFFEELSNKNYLDTSRTPLHLANLCLLFDTQGKLPSSSVRVSEKIVTLRLEQWDRERGFRRASHYSEFGPDEKRRFLAALSFQLASMGRIGGFSTHDLRQAYVQVIERSMGHFVLVGAQSADVINEIESHSGLIMQTEDGGYEFYHLTIFEYLCADYISRSQLDLLDLPVLTHIPEAVALASALAAAPDDFLLTLASRASDTASGFYAEITFDFWQRICTRLMNDQLHVPASLKMACVMLIAASWASKELDRARKAAQTSGQGVPHREKEAVRTEADCVIFLHEFISKYALADVIVRSKQYYSKCRVVNDRAVLSTVTPKVCGSIALPLTLTLPLAVIKPYWPTDER